jgi:hypothetical protein
MRHCGTLKGMRKLITGAKLLTVPLLRLGSLELFLQQETGVPEEAVLAYLSDGRMLRSDNVRELAGAQDQVRSVQPFFQVC